MPHIDWIEQRGWRFGKAETSPNAWYYCMPWVLVAAAAMVLLIYVTVLLTTVVTFIRRTPTKGDAAWSMPHAPTMGVDVQ
jgi:hypothetical protein